MNPSSLQTRSALDWIDDELAELDAAQLLRRMQITERVGPGCCHVEGRKLIDFGSNDYLGLATDPRVLNAARAELNAWGSVASPLLGGHTPAHQSLAERLAAFEGTESALVFSSGYAANVGTITALVSKGDVVYSDRLNHASIIDGCRLSRATIRRYPHRDVSALAEMMVADTQFERRLIVTDSLFSMDGNSAPLAELSELAEQFGAMLMVDEAHATGVFGSTGRGLCEAFGVDDRVHVRVGTLSKALGSVGGFVCGNHSLTQWLLNRARPYIFSTAHPAAACEAAAEALSIVEAEPQRGSELQQRAAMVRNQLQRQGWNLGPSTSQIIPIMVGDADKALKLAGSLREAGYYVPAIRQPSVPVGQSRLRLSLSWGHSEEMIDGLVEAFLQVV